MRKFYKCMNKKCNHEWIGHSDTAKPKYCPKCHNKSVKEVEIKLVEK